MIIKERNVEWTILFYVGAAIKGIRISRTFALILGWHSNIVTGAWATCDQIPLNFKSKLKLSSDPRKPLSNGADISPNIHQTLICQTKC